MSKFQSLLLKALKADTHAFIVYFCGLRSNRFQKLMVKSVYADTKPINLASSSCLLISGAKSRVEGYEVTQHCIPMKTEVATLTGLLCRHMSPEQILKWSVEVCVIETSSSHYPPSLVQFECNTSPNQESGSLTVSLGSPEDGELDVYYLAIRPAPVEDGSNYNPAVGFPMRPVSSTPVTTSAVAMIGHRGVGAEQSGEPEEARWPENTIHAFQKAAELQLPMSELDVLPMMGSKELAIYHNFNVKMKLVEGAQLSACGCPLQKIDLFDDPPKTNETLPNLLPTLSPEALRILLRKIDHNPSCKYNNNGSLLNGFKKDNDQESCAQIQLSRSSKLADYIPTFSQFLAKIPVKLGFDVEIKYPVETPFSAFRLIREQGETVKSLQGYGHPYRYFFPINEMVDNLLQVLRQKGNGRRIILSSFNPDICLALRLKQSTYPVFFISRGGIHPKGSVDFPQTLDPRHENGTAAALWAHLLQLDGVVLSGACMGAPGGGEVDGEGAHRLAGLLASLRLAAFPYGAGVSTSEYRQFAASIGLTAVCIDNAVNFAKTEDFFFP